MDMVVCYDANLLVLEGSAHLKTREPGVSVGVLQWYSNVAVVVGCGGPVSDGGVGPEVDIDCSENL